MSDYSASGDEAEPKVMMIKNKGARISRPVYEPKDTGVDIAPPTLPPPKVIVVEPKAAPTPNKQVEE